MRPMFDASRLAMLATALLVTSVAAAAPLVPYPPQDPATPYPTTAWPEAKQPAIEAIIERAFTGKQPVALERLRAVVVIHRGQLVAERYSTGLTKDSRLQSWSMAKSFLQAGLGLAIADGKLNPDAPAPVAEWSAPNDPRHAITVRQLAQMTDGLAFKENYANPNADAMQMLFGGGRGDVGASAAKTPLGVPPGTQWSYSSGSANILARVLRDKLGGREGIRALLFGRLFAPLGITSAVPEFDASGTWIGSSYVHATARDFARFGLLYLRGGEWEGKQLLPREWVDFARTSSGPSKGAYGALFWLNARDPATGKAAIAESIPDDTFLARGFGGQLIAIIPSRDAIIVMLNAAYTGDNKPIVDLAAGIIAALPR